MILENVSVIIPVADGEKDWRELLSCSVLNEVGEVILVGKQQTEETDSRIRWLAHNGNRARKLNAGAKESSRSFLWFLHADSRLEGGVVQSISRALESHSSDLHYFDLDFYGGSVLMVLNAWGVMFRSRILGIPFGDQGFLLAREVFQKIGHFDEAAPYGEDHLLVWKARKAGVRVRSLKARLSTSARKYNERGWLKTTATHLRLTFRQALMEMRRR